MTCLPSLCAVYSLTPLSLTSKKSTGWHKHWWTLSPGTAGGVFSGHLPSNENYGLHMDMGVLDANLMIPQNKQKGQRDPCFLNNSNFTVYEHYPDT